MARVRTAVLISGGGSNLQALIDTCQASDFPAEITLVISNVPDVHGLTRASNAGIPSLVINHKNFTSREAFDAALQSELEKNNIELVCLAGFMRILTPDFVDKWRGRILNTHPALLPKHGGKGMHGMHVHKAVLAAGDTTSGASIHYVIPEVDQGDVIIQKSIPVLPGDTADTLAARILEAEHKAYPEALKLVADGLLKS